MYQNPKNSDNQETVVIILTFEQYGLNNMILSNRVERE